MTKYCVFRLHGPLAAYGEVAVGQDRHTFPVPSKSAVLGLVAGALGVRRSEEEVHRALAEGYGFAVCADSPGTVVQDFHTAQVPPAVLMKKQNHIRTRKDELSVPRERLGTVLSRRDYLCDLVATVCLWQRKDEVPYTSEEFVAALSEPVFVPYLGRKSCPLGLPTEAQVVDATSVPEALDKAVFKSDAFLGPVHLSNRTGLYFDDVSGAGVSARQYTIRRDSPLSRTRWQFADRKEGYTVIDRNRSGA